MDPGQLFMGLARGHGFRVMVVPEGFKAVVGVQPSNASWQASSVEKRR